MTAVDLYMLCMAFLVAIVFGLGIMLTVEWIADSWRYRNEAHHNESDALDFPVAMGADVVQPSPRNSISSQVK